MLEAYVLLETDEGKDGHTGLHGHGQRAAGVVLDQKEAESWRNKDRARRMYLTFELSEDKGDLIGDTRIQVHPHDGMNCRFTGYRQVDGLETNGTTLGVLLHEIMDIKDLRPHEWLRVQIYRIKPDKK